MEEIELGESHENDEIDDDEGKVDVDPEALDSEDDSNDEDLGIDKEESEGRKMSKKLNPC